jgi:AraC-like DNA-binding protein/quercetin dioxygenase-like cupin family protein
MPPLTQFTENGAHFTYMRRFEEDGVRLQNLKGLSRVVAGRAGQPTAPHSHDLLEIHYVVRGTQYQVVEDTPYRMRSGDTLVTLPGEKHFSGALQEKRIDYYLALDIKTDKKNFLGSDSREALQLREQLAAIPRFFSTDNSLYPHLDEILEVYASTEVHKVILIHSLLNRFLIRLLSFSGQHSQRTLSAPVKAALLFAKNNLTKRLSVSDLAQQAGLAASAFRERFTKEIGQSPKEYLLRERMEAAIGLLREGKMSVTDIAHELQFSSSQHFAKMFRKILNRTPGEYGQLGDKEIP